MEQNTGKEEMNQKDFNAARCSVEVSTRIHEMQYMDLDTDRCSVETREGDPLGDALAIVEQQRIAPAPESVSSLSTTQLLRQ